MSSSSRCWLPVLLYHRVAPRPSEDPWNNFVSPETFESHLRWLRSWGYQSIPLGAVADALTGGPRLPRRAIAITFDDGYLDTHQFAWPLLRRYGYGATVFLVSDAIGDDSAFDAGSGYEPAPMLGWDQIRMMAIEGIEFGSHTSSHPETLVDLDGATLRRELMSSRRTIEAALDQPVDLFAYPHSKHDGRVEAAVAEAGYRLACGGVGTRFDPFCVSRVEAPQAPGPVVTLVAGWRRLKWRARATLPASPSNAA